MQIFEVILYVIQVCMIFLLLKKVKMKKSHMIFLTTVTLVIFILHLIFEPYRWQLLILYVSWIGLIIAVILRFLEITKHQMIFKAFLIGTMITIIVSLSVTFAFPVYDMPSVTGDYEIGTESFIIEDPTRLELYSEDETENRKFKIQCWYPAETTEGYSQVPWLEDGQVISRALSNDTGLPGFVLDHTSGILSNSYQEAPIIDKDEPLPVIVISHGWRGFRNLHTDFAEELASHGYFVVSIDHTYGSIATVFSDDDVAYVNLEALPQRDETSDFLAYANQLVDTYGQDVIATIDYLEAINTITSNSRFSDKLDMTKIGLLGHSTGGGGDVTAAIQDDRIDALIGLDAWVEPVAQDLMAQGLSIPSLFLRSGQWETGENNVNLYQIVQSNTQTSLLYQIDGTTHYDFTMVYMYSPLTKLIGFTGDVEGIYLNSILEAMILEFFDLSLIQDSYTESNTNDWQEVIRITDFTIEEE